MTPSRLLDTGNLGFLLTKAMQTWNDLLRKGFRQAGYPEIRPSYGSVLIPLFEEDGLRMGELCSRGRLSKQAMTTMARVLERKKMILRRQDENDGRASRIWLSKRMKDFAPIAERIVRSAEQEVDTVLGQASKKRLKTYLKIMMSIKHKEKTHEN